MSLIKLALPQVYNNTQRVLEMLAKGKPLAKAPSKVIPMADKLKESLKQINV